MHVESPQTPHRHPEDLAIWHICRSTMWAERHLFPPRKTVAYAINQQPLTHQLIASVSYYLLSTIAVLMKLFWCGNETGQDKQMRKQKGFRVTQNVNVLSHTELNLGPQKGYKNVPSAVSNASILFLWHHLGLNSPQLLRNVNFLTLQVLPPRQKLSAIELLEINYSPVL